MPLDAAPFSPGSPAARWLALVAHELRNPLQPLRSFVALARRRPLSESELQCRLDALDRQLDLLQRLVDDLACLGAAGWGPDRLARERVALRALVEQALEGARPMLAARGQSLFVQLQPGDHCVRGDADRLLQVAGNLLSNAVKFTPPGGSVQVQLRQEGETEALEVLDSGCGLAHGDVLRIFQPFTRGVGASGPAGLGIGLAIVRLFVEQHGGTVEAAAAVPGTGSRFTVRLPCWH